MTKHTDRNTRRVAGGADRAQQAEKELTRRSDELALRRQALPWVRVDKTYRFETDEGSCLAGGSLPRALAAPRLPLHVRARLQGGLSVVLLDRRRLRRHRRPSGEPRRRPWAVSRAPLAKLQAYKRRMGWTFPWASSAGSDFNFDFNVSFTEAQQREGTVDYNYRRAGHAMDMTPAPEPVVQLAATSGTDVPTYALDRPGLSAFVLEDGAVYHTYSTFARGLDGLWGMYQWLDRAPKGRNETGPWCRRHDEYGKSLSDGALR